MVELGDGVDAVRHVVIVQHAEETDDDHGRSAVTASAVDNDGMGRGYEIILEPSDEIQVVHMVGGRVIITDGVLERVHDKRRVGIIGFGVGGETTPGFFIVRGKIDNGHLSHSPFLDAVLPHGKMRTMREAPEI